VRRLIAVPIAASLLAFAAMPMAQAAPTKAYGLTAKLTDTSIVLGDYVKVGGTVTGPGAVGSKVRVYIHYANYESGVYDYLGYDLVDSNGKYSKKIRPTDSGDTVVKVVKDASSSRKRATKSLNLDTYGWLELGQLTKTVEHGVVSASEVSYGNGDRTYSEGFLFKLDGRAHWDLHKKCTKYDGNSGMDDSSVSGSFGQAKPIAQRSSGTTIREGSAVSRSQGDAAKHETLKLYAASDHSVRARYLEITTQVDGSGTPAWALGAPAVYCNLPGGIFEED
jgi:hypothetical protein